MIKEIDKPKASRAKLVPPFDPPRPFDGSASPQRTFHTATASNGAHETKNKQDPFESFAQKFSRKPRIPPLLDRTDTIELSILNHGSLIPEHWGSCGGDEVHPFHDVHRQAERQARSDWLSANPNKSSSKAIPSLPPVLAAQHSMGIVFRQFLDSAQVVVCKSCRTHLTDPEEVISKEFQGQHGRAYLYATVINIVLGSESTRSMTTGEHVVANIYCTYCDTRLGWKYVKAYEPSQKYKVGHYILERSLVSEIEQSYFRTSIHQAVPLGSAAVAPSPIVDSGRSTPSSNHFSAATASRQML